MRHLESAVARFMTPPEKFIAIEILKSLKDSQNKDYISYVERHLVASAVS